MKTLIADDDSISRNLPYVMSELKFFGRSGDAGPQIGQLSVPTLPRKFRQE
jgi:hypothetical protein